jgi:hypothetical protein
MPAGLKVLNYPEDGGCMLLQNIGKKLLINRALYPGELQSQLSQ